MAESDLTSALNGRPGRSDRHPAAPVTFDSSLTIPAVWACVSLRADLVSTMPVDVFRRRVGGRPEPVETPVVLEQPSAVDDITDWMFASQISLDLRGNAFGLYTSWDRLGRPTSVELQHPDTVGVVKTAAGQLRYTIGGKTYEPSQVWHERAFVVPGRVLGLSPIAYAAMAMGVNLAAEQFGSDWFADSATPSALLTNNDVDTISETAAKVAKQRFIAAVKGSREPVVLAGGWEYHALQVSPNESQFLDTMRFGVQQVARLFRVPPELIGADSGGRSGLTYANTVDRALDFLKFSLGPTLTRRERSLSRLTPNRQFVKLNRGALLATDLLTRYKAHEIAIRSKFLTQDEAREHEDMEPLTPEQVEQLTTLGSSSVAPLPVTQEG